MCITVVFFVVHSPTFCLCLLKVELINLAVFVFRQRLTWVSGRVASNSIKWTTLKCVT